jgi:NMD protein affecting ribosome stability and mRNA decay
VKCCSNCFKDTNVIFTIKKNGTIGNCNYCGAINTTCLEVNHEELLLYFELFKKIYSKNPVSHSRELINIIFNFFKRK